MLIQRGGGRNCSLPHEWKTLLLRTGFVLTGFELMPLKKVVVLYRAITPSSVRISGDLLCVVSSSNRFRNLKLGRTFRLAPMPPSGNAAFDVDAASTPVDDVNERSSVTGTPFGSLPNFASSSGNLSSCFITLSFLFCDAMRSSSGTMAPPKHNLSLLISLASLCWWVAAARIVHRGFRLHWIQPWREQSQHQQQQQPQRSRKREFAVS